MFSFFKSDPIKKLRKEHAKLLEQAMLSQRNGDMRSYASITAESEKIWLQIQELEKD